VDAISQITLGATIAEAGFRHRLGGKSVVVGAACGLFPDLDLLAGLVGQWGSLIHHRGLTHSLIVLTALSPLFGWIGYRWSKRRDRLLGWIHLAFWALTTHALLDWCTSYGTQLFAPLSNHRFSLDAVPIIDLFYTVPLIVVVVMAIARRPGPELRRRIAAGALAFTTPYLTFGYFQSRGAVSTAERQLRASGFEPTGVRAIPILLMVGPYRIVARDAGGNIRVGHLSTFTPRRIRFLRLDRSRDPLVDRLLKGKYGRIFRWASSRMVYARVVRKADRTEVYLQDMRYGLVTRPTSSHFQVRAEFDRNGRLMSVRRLRRMPRISIGAELRALTRLIATGRVDQPAGLK
jgi:inner membrane protein